MVVFLPFFLCRFFGDFWPCFNFAVFNISRFFSNLKYCRFFCILNCLPFFHLPFIPRNLGFSRFLYFICLFRPFELVLKLLLFEGFFFCRFRLPFRLSFISCRIDFCRFLSCHFFEIFMVFRFFFHCSFYLSVFFFKQEKKTSKKTTIAQKNTMICYAELILSPFPSDLN